MIKMLYVPCETFSEAEKIAEELLNKNLIACANIIKESTSLYKWQGKIKTEKEAILIAKTTDENLEEATNTIESLHSYDIPAVISFEANSNQPYEIWLNDVFNTNSVTD